MASPALRLRTSITEFLCESKISDPKFLYVSLVLKDSEEIHAIGDPRESHYPPLAAFPKLEMDAGRDPKIH